MLSNGVRLLNLFVQWLVSALGAKVVQDSVHVVFFVYEIKVQIIYSIATEPGHY